MAKRSTKKLKIISSKKESSYQKWAEKMEQEGNCFIENWKELSKCKSETHKLNIDIKMCSGHIHPKIKSNKSDSWDDYYYLSTHTFYGLNYKKSTKELQKRGFKVYLLNWDLDSNHY